MTHTQAVPEERSQARRQPHKDEEEPLELFWLDFHNPDDGAFMGACVVPAPRDEFIEAVQAAHHFKCNPGGQCTWIGVENLQRAPRSYLARLLNEDDVVKLMAILRSN